MNNKRRTVITLETREVTIIRARRQTVSFCEFCRRDVQTLTLDAAAIVLQSAPNAVLQRAELGELHFLETPNGRRLLCGNSLLASKQNQKELKK